MYRIFYIWLATLSMAVSFVSTADQRVYPPHNPVRRTHDTPLEYYLDHLDEFTKQAEQKRARTRLDSYNPDSEVELVETNQPQPPKPMVLNIPHIVPGQRVFVVQVPVTGYRPVVSTYPYALAPQDNFSHRGSAYPNPVVLDPQSVPMGSILDYDKNGIIPPHEMGSSFQRPYDFYPNPKPENIYFVGA